MILLLTFILICASPAVALGSAQVEAKVYKGIDIDPKGIVRILDGTCSGVMVSPTVFITAAHCAPAVEASKHMERGLVVGASNYSDGLVRKVVDHRIPAEYSMPESVLFEWDLMVALIDRPVPLDQVKPLGLRIPEIPFYGLVGGWGITDEGESLARRPTAAVVRGWVQAEPTPWPRLQDCEAFQGWGILCQLPDEDSETCAGDSGSPFQVDGVVYGIAVAGYPGCGRWGELPGYTLDLTNSQYREWLGKAVSDLDPTRLGVGHFSGCAIDSAEISGKQHVVFSRCADGAEIVVREDGVITITREQYFGAYWIRVQAPGLCLVASFDGFGSLIQSEDCSKED